MPTGLPRTRAGAGASTSPKSVCVGKEWYRFPSHFFLPHNYHLQFVKSEFSGLLPKPFSAEGGADYGVPCVPTTNPSPSLPPPSTLPYSLDLTSPPCDVLACLCASTSQPSTLPAPWRWLRAHAHLPSGGKQVVLVLMLMLSTLRQAPTPSQPQ